MTFDHMQITTAVALIAGYFSAHAAGFLTRAHAPAWVLGAVTAILATLAGVLPTVAWHSSDSWKVYVGNVFAALVATTLGHKSQIPTKLKQSSSGVVG